MAGRQIVLGEKCRLGFTLGFLVALLGSYLGNTFVTLSHGILLAIFGLAAVHWISGRWTAEAEGQNGGRDERATRIRASTWCLIGLMVAMAASLLANLDQIECPWKVVKKLRYPLVWTIALLLPWPRRVFLERKGNWWFPWMLLAWYGSIGLATVSGLIGHVTGFNPLRLAVQPQARQVSGIYGTVMTYAYSMQLSFLLLGGLFLQRHGLLRFLSQGKNWVAKATVGTLLLSAAGLYFGQARGAVLGIVVGLFGMAFLYRSKWILGGIAIAGIVAGGIAYESRSRYFASLESESVRVSQWSTAWQTFLRHPWFGVGYRQFEERCVELKREMDRDFDWYRVKEDGSKVPIHYKGHAHNEYLEAFASTGVFGGLFFLGFCGFWCREIARAKACRRIFLPAILALLVSSLVQNVFTDSEVMNFILLIYFVSQVALDWEEGQARDGVAGMPQSSVALRPTVSS